MNKLIALIISIVTAKFLKVFFFWLSHLVKRKEIKNKNTEIKEGLINADTKEEREKAARAIIDNS